MAIFRGVLGAKIKACVSVLMKHRLFAYAEQKSGRLPLGAATVNRRSLCLFCGQSRTFSVIRANAFRQRAVSMAISTPQISEQIISHGR